jgi:hypothetical protein
MSPWYFSAYRKLEIKDHHEAEIGHFQVFRNINTGKMDRILTEAEGISPTK